MSNNGLMANGLLVEKCKFDFSGKEAYSGVSKSSGKVLGELDLCIDDAGPPGETAKQKRKRLEVSCIFLHSLLGAE